jgi:hypothetical protein
MSNISTILSDQRQQKIDLLKKEFDKTMTIYQDVKNDYMNDISQIPTTTKNLTINEIITSLKSKMDDIADQIRRVQDMYQFETDIIKIQQMDSDMNDLVSDYTQANNDYITAVTNVSPTNGTVTEGMTDSDSSSDVLSPNSASTVTTDPSNTTVTPATDSSTLADKQKTLSDLNDKLINMTGIYLNELSPINTDMQTEITQKDIDHGKLEQIYGELLEDRQKISEMIDEYGSLDREYSDNIIKTKQNETHFSVDFSLFILFLFYLIKVLILPDAQSNIFSAIFWISFFLYFMFTTFRLNEPVGFMLWGTMIIFFVLTKMDIIPSP